MQIKNGNLYTQGCFFEPHDLILSGDRITRIAPSGFDSNEEEVLDAAGCYVLPGFVDVHIHGADGADFCDDTSDHISTISNYLGKKGVTSFLGTTMAFSEEILNHIVDDALPHFNQEEGGAVLRGINMEGPFFAKSKKGAQAERYIIDPDFEMFERLMERSKNNIRLCDIAPELPGAVEFISRAAKQCAVSIAHTTATYEEAKEGFAAGANHVTHLFNAMPPFAHRDPGVVGAALEDADYVELISDGIHIHPAMVRTVFQIFGADRVCLISDAMRATGKPNGEYTLGGQKVSMSDGKATLADGTIAGSATDLVECFRRAVHFGVPLEMAAKAATINPAKSVGLEKEIGSCSEGKRADLLILAQDLSVKAVIIGGKRIV